jgi:alanyl-tRNA synthetase
MPHRMTTDEIREAFLRFFEARGHRRMPSAPLVPVDDPTLLFTSAGMVQFKPYFMGRAVPPAPRLTTVQRCFRTTDIEEVGDSSHHTFFEMLGNFSVGDYFKAEAIPWAWEFVTEVLGLPADRLWITVYRDDDEAYDLWRALGRPAERIRRYGMEQNYWPPDPSVLGPCGPCSEIHYDWGEEFGCGPACEPAHDCGRFLEIWNLVFMTYMRHPDGSLTELPQKNIDTGAGLERLSMAVQGVRDSYRTTGLRPLIEAAAALADRRYGDDPAADLALRVVTDHARAVAFLIADGVLPSNEGRGYVLRRVLRRAVYFGRTVRMPAGFMEAMAAAVLDHRAALDPYLAGQRRLVLATVAREEAAFRETLERGLTRLDELLAQVAPGQDALPGEEVFRLYETYGVPKELTVEVAARHGLRVDEAGYERALAAARERSRAAAGGRATFRLEEVADAFARLAGQGDRFEGYDRTALDTHITGLIRGRALVERVEEGQQALVVLAETPFYPEGGGQVGDTGRIVSDTGRVTVTDTRRDASGVIYHVGQVTAGYLTVHDQVRAEVDPARRQDAARNHTGTHLLHAALRRVLGEHVHQQGSLVAPDRLRFDYNHLEAPTPDQLDAVRLLVNDYVRADVTVRTRETSLEQAQAEGVLAIFGEKYGERVRVVEIDGDGRRPFSAELCGGTHVHETGEIGGLFIIDEGSIGAGLRRIEALTGAGAERWIAAQIRVLESASRRLGGSPAELEARIIALQEELAAERRRAEALAREASRREAGALAEQAETVAGVRIVVAQVTAAGMDALRRIGDELRRYPGPTFVVLGTVADGRPLIVAMGKDLDGRIHAGRLLTEVRARTGVGGGGRPDVAQGGGTDPAKLPEALALARRLAKEHLAGHG